MAPSVPQLNYLADLATKLWARDPEMLLAQLGDASCWNGKQASAKIDLWKGMLKAQSKAALPALPAPKVIPVGTYLAMGQIVKVKIAKKSGAPYLLAENGTYLGALKGDAPKMLAEIEADPKGCAIAYGKATGNCCICSKTLTNPASIEAGIGPVCAGKF